MNPSETGGDTTLPTLTEPIVHTEPAAASKPRGGRTTVCWVTLNGCVCLDAAAGASRRGGLNKRKTGQGQVASKLPGTGSMRLFSTSTNPTSPLTVMNPSAFMSDSQLTDGFSKFAMSLRLTVWPYSSIEM